MTAIFGKISVLGTPAQLALAAKAYTGQTHVPHLEDALLNPYTIEFHTKAEFIAAKRFIPGTKNAAWGYVMGHRTLWVNSDEKAGHQLYTLRHEPCHALQDDRLTAAKKQSLLPLMNLKGGGHPTSWNSGAYPNHPCEIMADALVEAFWGPGTVLDRYYGDIADSNLPVALSMLLGANTQPVDPPVDPLPLPLPDPRDDLIAQLQARVAVLTSAGGYLIGDVEAALVKFKDRAAA